MDELNVIVPADCQIDRATDETELKSAKTFDDLDLNDLRILVEDYRGYQIIFYAYGAGRSYIAWPTGQGAFSAPRLAKAAGILETESIIGLKQKIDSLLGAPSPLIEQAVRWAAIMRSEMIRAFPNRFPFEVRHGDYDLVVEGYRGHNIVHAYGLFYAWPQSAGSFTIERFLAAHRSGDADTAPVQAVSLGIVDVKYLIDIELGQPTPEQEKPQGSVPTQLDWANVAPYEAIFVNRFWARDAARRGALVSEAKPPFVIASTAFGCNIECKMCYLLGEDYLAYDGPYGRKAMSDDTWERVKGLVPTTEIALMTVEGEILVHTKWFDRWLELAKLHPNLKLGFQTNGMIMNDHVIDIVMENPSIIQVAISIDGATPSTNDDIRTGAKLNLILKNIEKLVERKKLLGKSLPNLHTHFVMMRENIHELPLYVERMHRLGINSMTARHIIARRREDIEQALYFDQERADKYILAAREVARRLNARIELPDTFAESKAKGVDRRPDCFDPWLHGQILHDGSMWSCCNNAVKMGNINEEDGFEGVWNNEKYQKLRQTINTDEPYFTACKYCYAMLPVHHFESFIETRVLFKILEEGGEAALREWCPGPIELRVKPGELYVG